jgi:hypothetical protein
MRTYKKEVNGLNMTAWKDSGAYWAIQSTDSDGFARTQYYECVRFTMRDALELHASLYSSI